MQIRFRTPEVFKPLYQPARYKGAKGGRGSGKSHTFAEMMIDRSFDSGTRSVCIREVQKSLKQSSKLLIEDKLREFWINESHGFKIFKEVIETPGDGVIIFQGMNNHNSESIKSLEGFNYAWIEEAQTLSRRSLSLLRPTIRAEESELWFSWNPRHETDAVDRMFCGGIMPSDAALVTANWRDNPFFPEVLNRERLDCLRQNPEQYDHIWEGGYIKIMEGAYYARDIAEARKQNRIGKVQPDPLMKRHLFCDIGGTGAHADAFAIWAAQIIGREIRVLNYYEAVGQPLAAHLVWMREQGYDPGKAQIWLPHDGASNDKVYSVSYESALKQAGYDVEVVPNQGRGAAKARIEAARRYFASCWFDEDKTRPGIEALGWYHEKTDEARNIGLGPEHDWSSHGADAFGLLAVVVESLFDKPRNRKAVNLPRISGWMN